MRYLAILTLLLFFISKTNAQKLILLIDTVDKKVIPLKRKHIKNVLTMESQLFENVKEINDNGIVVEGNLEILFANIHSIEYGKKRGNPIFNFFKIVGIGAVGAGALMTSAALDTDDESGLALSIAGVSLIASGAGTIYATSRLKKSIAKSDEFYYLYQYQVKGVKKSYIRNYRKVIDTY